MSEHLAKAKGALAHASSLDPADVHYQDLLVIGRVQAEIAQAEALVQIAELLAGGVS